MGNASSLTFSDQAGLEDEGDGATRGEEMREATEKTSGCNEGGHAEGWC